MIYRSLHGFAPDYLTSKFQRRETAYNLRHSEFHYRAQTITEIVLGLVASFFGTVLLVT